MGRVLYTQAIPLIVPYGNGPDMSTMKIFDKLNLGTLLGCPAEASVASRSRTAQQGAARPNLRPPVLSFILPSRL